MAACLFVCQVLHYHLIRKLLYLKVKEVFFPFKSKIHLCFKMRTISSLCCSQSWYIISVIDYIWFRNIEDGFPYDCSERKIDERDCEINKISLLLSQTVFLFVCYFLLLSQACIGIIFCQELLSATTNMFSHRKSSCSLLSICLDFKTSHL